MTRFSRLSVALIATAAFFASVAPASADRGGDQGVGVMIGNPTGFTYKMFIDDRIAVDGAFGVDQSELDAHLTLLIHDFNILGRSQAFGDLARNGDLPVYFGVGPRALFADDDTEFGIRLPVGVSYLPHQTPWEGFVELAPVIRLTPTTGLDMDFAVGVRYYFPAIRPRG